MRLTLAVLVASMAPLAFAAESVSAIGTWTVTQVETYPTMPITAVVDLEPVAEPCHRRVIGDEVEACLEAGGEVVSLRADRRLPGGFQPVALRQCRPGGERAEADQRKDGAGGCEARHR